MAEIGYVAKIAPLIHLPLKNTQVFSYGSLNPIATGTLMKIPFRNRYVEGIVISCAKNNFKNSSFKLKNVGEIIAENMITGTQIELARAVSEYYFAPLGVIFKMMVPTLPKIKKKESEKTSGNHVPIVKDSQITQKIHSSSKKEFALLGERQERQKELLNVMARTANTGGQILYLAPEVLSAWAAYDLISKHFGSKEISLVYGGQTRGIYLKEWDKIRTGAAKIIIATKIGVWLPFSNLRMIAIDEEQNKSFKQWDMSPRYSAIRVGEILVQITGAKLIYSSSAYSTLIRHHELKKTLKALEVARNESSRSVLKIINLYDQRKKPDFPLTEELRKLIDRNLNAKKQVLVVAARRGYSRVSLCKNCKAVMRCPECDRAMVYFGDAEKYCCLHCTYKSDILSVCPTCGACNFSHLGAGIDFVERKLKSTYPSQRILKLTRIVSKSEAKKKILLERIVNSDIIIGTPVALQTGDVSRFGLAAILNWDEMAGPPDFNTRDYLYSILAQTTNLVAHDGIAAIQTFNPENDSLKYFKQNKDREFADLELVTRNRLNLPPNFRLIKLVFREKFRKKTEEELKNMFDLLERLGDNSINVGEPYQPYVSKKRGYYYGNLLLKINAKEKAWKYNNRFRSVLKGLGKGWQIDVDPISTV